MSKQIAEVETKSHRHITSYAKSSLCKNTRAREAVGKRPPVWCEGWCSPVVAEIPVKRKKIVKTRYAGGAGSRGVQYSDEGSVFDAELFHFELKGFHNVAL